ncbi:putative dehydrogenase [Mucilaginibacter yixingensis]|uniref:Putative dehydrogenase n=1 Tax=Mucilaginibacter yixingensis TaxID=1295612 RepID=A0A2T5J7D6_9SPHI|nr:Gfo/Idh/MocA family oxidoreductase [Mucilaginibacter yixingensis]PTQ95062.1 putative dehydrogenase [Mucilaginibacter yixingensis]
MNKKVRWGVLSTAKIGLTQVIPAMQQGQYSEVVAIASANAEKVTEAAARLGIAQIFNSYEDLLASPDVDAIYNPLPNHLHVPYTIKALQAGKHVLCEKPIGLNPAEAQQLIDAAAQYPHLKVMEAFMYRFHPQWQKAKEIVADGLLGEVKYIHTDFSYHNIDPANIRNKPEVGGGALMDIGCYCISFPRFIWGQEPQRVVGLVHRDAEFGTDTLTTGLLDFGDGRQASLSCSTRMEPFQRAAIGGDKGRLEIEIPVNAPADVPVKLYLQRNREIEEIIIPAYNQYTLQGDAISEAIINNTAAPTPLADALGNMRVIDALVSSAKQGIWMSV